jgi:hypothetical protein
MSFELAIHMVARLVFTGYMRKNWKIKSDRNTMSVHLLSRNSKSMLLLASQKATSYGVTPNVNIRAVKTTGSQLRTARLFSGCSAHPWCMSISGFTVSSALEATLEKLSRDVFTLCISPPTPSATDAMGGLLPPDILLEDAPGGAFAEFQLSGLYGLVGSAGLFGLS